MDQGCGLSVVAVPGFGLLGFFIFILFLLLFIFLFYYRGSPQDFRGVSLHWERGLLKTYLFLIRIWIIVIQGFFAYFLWYLLHSQLGTKFLLFWRLDTHKTLRTWYLNALSSSKIFFWTARVSNLLRFTQIESTKL